MSIQVQSSIAEVTPFYNTWELDIKDRIPWRHRRISTKETFNEALEQTAAEAVQRDRK